MNALYRTANKQSKALGKDLETFAESPESAPLSLQGQISVTLTGFAKSIEDYATAASHELVADRKETAQERVVQFRDQLAEYKETFKRLKLLREEAIHSNNKSELLGRRPRAAGGEPANNENPYANPPAGAPIARHDGLLREQDVLNRASNQLDEYIERGRLVLGDLSEQSDILRNTQKGLANVASTLGLSGETIRLATRRAKEDKWIFYGGIAVLVLCFYLIIRWLG